MTRATTATGRNVTVYSVAEALRIGRTIPCQPDQREHVARCFALIDAPLGGMRETARIIGELSADRIPGRMRTTAAFMEGRA